MTRTGAREQGAREQGHANKRGAKVQRLEATRLQVTRWKAAMSWRRRVNAALVGSGLRFHEWLVLEATCRLIRETGDAVSQNQVATRLQVTRMCVTNAMRTLGKRAFVSRGEAMSGPAWRVYVTREGVQFLRENAQSVEDVSVET